MSLAELSSPVHDDASGAVYADYAAFARAVYQTGVLSDPWLDGNERFGLRAALLTARRARALAEAAERVAYIHQELVQILIESPELLAGFYRLTPCQQAMWQV